MRRGFDEFPLLCDKLSPVPTAHMPTLWETIATDKPYPVKAALIFGSNALISYSNANRVKEAMEKLEFIAVCDLFMTPTAEMADIVLPASSWLERDNLISSFQVCPTYTIAQQKAVELAEARSDVDIVCDLAKKLGLAEHFWNDSEELYDFLLEPTGLTFHGIQGEKTDLCTRWFTGSSKKTASIPLPEKWNCTPPSWKRTIAPPCPPIRSPLKAPPPPRIRRRSIPTSSPRAGGSRSTGTRKTAKTRLLREIHPRPGLLIHPDTAARLEISEGDPVIIETGTGSATLFAVLTLGIHPDVVQATPGWRGKANINRVIPWDRFAEGIGSVPMRGVLCRLKKGSADSGDPEDGCTAMNSRVVDGDRSGPVLGMQDLRGGLQTGTRPGSGTPSHESRGNRGQVARWRPP